MRAIRTLYCECAQTLAVFAHTLATTNAQTVRGGPGKDTASKIHPSCFVSVLYRARRAIGRVLAKTRTRRSASYGESTSVPLIQGPSYRTVCARVALARRFV